MFGQRFSGGMGDGERSKAAAKRSGAACSSGGQGGGTSAGCRSAVGGGGLQAVEWTAERMPLPLARTHTCAPILLAPPLLPLVALQAGGVAHGVGMPSACVHLDRMKWGECCVRPARCPVHGGWQPHGGAVVAVPLLAPLKWLAGRPLQRTPRPAGPERLTAAFLAHLCALRSTSGCALVESATVMASRHVSRQASPEGVEEGETRGELWH